MYYILLDNYVIEVIIIVKRYKIAINNNADIFIRNSSLNKAGVGPAHIDSYINMLLTVGTYLLLTNV